MPEIAITDFSYGLQTMPDPAQLRVGAAQVAENVLVERGDLRIREGRSQFARCPVSTSSGLRALAELYVAGHTPAHRFVGIIGTKIYWTVDATTAIARENNAVTYLGQAMAYGGNLYECITAGQCASSPPTFNTTDGATTTDGTTVWTRRALPLFQEINSSYTVNASNRVRMLQYDDCLYICDGSNPVRRLSVDGKYTSLTDFPAPSVAPTVTLQTNIVTVDDAADNVSVFGKTADTGRYRGYLYGSPSPGVIPSSWLHDGSVSDKHIWHAYLGDKKGPGSTFPDHTEVMGATARLLTGAGNVIDGQASSIALEICAQAATSTMSCGDVALIRRCAATDFSAMSALTFKMKVISGTGSAEVPTDMALIFSEDGSIWTSVPVTLTGWTNDAEKEFVVDISAVADASLNSVVYYGFYFDSLALDVTARVEVSSGDFCYPNTYLSPNEDAESGAYIVLGPITGTVPDDETKFTVGEYEFTYSYFDTETGTESAEYINRADLAAPYTSVTLTAGTLPQSIDITGTKDAGSSSEGMRVYARTVLTGDAFRRIGEVYWSSGSALLSWDGTIDAGATTLTEYVGAPPRGASMLARYNNRMVYVASPPEDAWLPEHVTPVGSKVIPTSGTASGYVYRASQGGTTGATEPTWADGVTDGTVVWEQEPLGAADTLYFSNFGDPTQVPIAATALVQVPATYGGWQDLERAGTAVTGIATLGNMLVAMKSDSLWIITGDPGQPDFAVNQVSSVDGCLSHESIQQAEGRLIWQARDKVLAFDGVHVDEISALITPTVQGYSETQQAGAYGVYDPQARRYYLFYKDTGVQANNGIPPEATALVLQFKGKAPAWTLWTEQPDTCGLYAAHATTPGVYYADSYGTDGGGKLFCIDESVTTDAASTGAAAAITWRWVSGMVEDMKSRRAQEVACMTARVLAANSVGVYTVTLGFWPSNASGSAVSKSCTVRSLDTVSSISHGLVYYYPAPRECEGVAFLISRGTGTHILGVRALTIELQPRGFVR